MKQLIDSRNTPPPTPVNRRSSRICLHTAGFSILASCKVYHHHFQLLFMGWNDRAWVLSKHLFPTSACFFLAVFWLKTGTGRGKRHATAEACNWLRFKKVPSLTPSSVGKGGGESYLHTTWHVAKAQRITLPSTACSLSPAIINQSFSSLRFLVLYLAKQDMRYESMYVCMDICMYSLGSTID